MKTVLYSYFMLINALILDILKDFFLYMSKHNRIKLTVTGVGVKSNFVTVPMPMLFLISLARFSFSKYNRKQKTPKGA